MLHLWPRIGARPPLHHHAAPARNVDGNPGSIGSDAGGGHRGPGGPAAVDGDDPGGRRRGLTSNGRDVSCREEDDDGGDDGFSHHFESVSFELK